MAPPNGPVLKQTVEHVTTKGDIKGFLQVRGWGQLGWYRTIGTRLLFQDLKKVTDI